MSTKANTITDSQIAALRIESDAQGDDDGVILCTLALELELNETFALSDYEERFGGGGLRPSASLLQSLPMTGAEARLSCELVIEELALMDQEARLIRRRIDEAC